jgi:hypothetical protein
LAAVLIGGFLVALAIFAAAQAFGLVAYLLAYCLVFGGVAWTFRSRVRPALARARLDNLAGFLLLAVGASSLEETLSDLFAGPGSLIIHNLPLDLLWIDLIWLGWLLPWYLWVPRRFAFGEVETLLVGGSTGLLFEVVIARVFFEPVLALLWIPFAWAIYAVTLLLPAQVIRFPTTSIARWKVPSTLAVTWGCSAGVALGLYVVFIALGFST